MTAQIQVGVGVTIPRFSVRLSHVRRADCNAMREDGPACDSPPTLVATLVYCSCGDAHRPAETCPDDGAGMEPDLIPVCEVHGAAIRQSWECFRRLTTYDASQETAPKGGPDDAR